MVVPSGKVTVTLEPGSPVPATVSVPLALALVVAVGAVGAERTITNVAAGTLAKGSTDAVNGDQLFSAQQKTAAASKVASNALQRSGGTMSGGIDMGGHALRGLSGPDD